MTVTTTSSRISYIGDGVSVAFAFPYYFLAPTDIVPLLDSVEQQGGFTVTGAGNAQGGTVTFTTAPAVGVNILLVRSPDLLQSTDFPPNDPFPADAVERGLDKLTMIAQKLSTDESRSVRFPLAETVDGELPLAGQRANKAYAFDVNGNPTFLPLPSSLGAGDLNWELGIDGTRGFKTGVDFTPNVTAQLTLSRSPGNDANVWVYWDANPQTDFFTAGNKLNFPTAIPSGVSVVNVRIGTTLSLSVPATQSVGDAQLNWAGILFRSVDSVASLLALDGTTHDRAYVMGYYGPNTAGGGPVYKDSADTTSAANGVTIFVGNDGTRWKRPPLGYATLSMAGAYGDGNLVSPHDDSAFVQACLDAMKGMTVIADKGKTFYLAGVTMSGSSYNGTSIVGDGLFKLKPDAGGVTFGGGWVGLLIQQCDAVKVKVRFDGNRLNMTAREQIICVGVAGASNLDIDGEFSEIRGDGVYLGQADWLSNSGHSINVRIRIKGTNTADDGRNLLSVIDCSGLLIEDLDSYRVGGTINGVVMPGGLDIEPDFGYQSVSDVTIKNLKVVTAGTSGFGIVGKSVSGVDANLDWNCTDIRVEKWKVLKIGTSGSAISGSPFTRVADLRFGEGSYQYNTTPGAGPVFDYCQRVGGKLIVSNVTYGAWLAPSGTFFDPDIEIIATNFNIAGVRTTDVQGGRIVGSAKHAIAGSTSFAVQCYSNSRTIVQGNVTYEVDAPYDNVMARAFRNEPGLTVGFGTGTRAQNCDWSGYASYSVTSDALIPLKNVRGMTSAAAMPDNGTWHWETFVENTQRASAASKTTLGWSRLNSGSNNVASTDWVACVCTNS